MMLALFDDLQNLRSSTEILEALNWDDEKYAELIEELGVMLASSPPNVSKALFWLKNTPWETFDRQRIPDNIYKILEKNILFCEGRMKIKARKAKMLRHKAPNNNSGEWN